MNSDMKIEQKINQIVNSITGRNKIRLNELGWYPICILYGKFSEVVKGMFQLEMSSAIGSEELFEIVSINSEEEIGSIFTESIDQFRNSMEKGKIKLLNQYYIPIIFMCDQLKAEQMKKIVLKIRRRMEKLGFENRYRIAYYCVLNYEYMDGKKCKEQILNLEAEQECNYPFYIYTHNNLFSTDYQKYQKNIQTIAMHIFLNTSQLDVGMFSISDQKSGYKYFIMGYWKFDIYKQKIINFFIENLKRQEKKLMNISDYENQINHIIERILFWEKNDWIQRWAHMPINYTQFHSMVQPKKISFKKIEMSMYEICRLMYGREDAFSEFIRENLGNGTEAEFIEIFLKSDIGNLYAVTEMLKEALDNILKRYQKEKQEYLKEQEWYEPIFRFYRKYTITEMIIHFQNSIWVQEAELIDLERKIAFVKNLLVYIETQVFKEEIRGLRERNKDNLSLLKIIRREILAILGDNELKAEEKESAVYETRIPVWNEDVFEVCNQKDYWSEMYQIKERTQEWMQNCISDVMGEFIVKLQNIKMYYHKELYFSARIISLGEDNEEEYLYTGTQAFQQKEIEKKLKSIAINYLPKVNVLSRTWEDDMCFEFFVIKKIQSLDEIYNMNERGRGN